MNGQEIAALICARLGECFTALAASFGGAPAAKAATGKPAAAATPAAAPAGMDPKEKVARDKVNAAASDASVRLKNAGQSPDEARAAVKAVIAEHGGGAQSVADIPAANLKAVHAALSALDAPKPADSGDEW